MNGIEKLMSKWWFRLVLILATGIILFVVSMCTIPQETDKTNYANTGFTVFSVLGIYIAITLMYLTTDIMDNMRLKVGKVLRKLIFFVSLALFAAVLFLGLLDYIIQVKDGDVIQPFYDGLAFAPILTYLFLYFFVVGKYEETENHQPNRKKQFVVMLIAFILPIAIGIVIAWALKAINDSGIAFIVLVVLLVLVVGSMVVSYKKFGFLLGGMKEYDREKPASSSDTLSQVSDCQDWEAKFMYEIQHNFYDTYTSVSAYAYIVDGCIYVDAKINYYGSNDEGIRASAINDIADKVRSVYREVAKECPYSSKLNIKVE